MRLHGARRDEKACGDVLVAEPLADESHHVEFGWRQRLPTARRAFALAAAPLRVGDRLFGRQRRAFRPCGLEVRFAHRISESAYRGLIGGSVDREAHFTGATTDSLARTE